MNESSVSSPFMKALRIRLPAAVVVKHRDSSMIGLPDCSVSFGGHALWVEFKLYDWQDWMEGKFELEIGMHLLAKATEAALAQRMMMGKLGVACGSLYAIWVRKSFVLLVDPVRLQVVRLGSTPAAVEFVARLMLDWRGRDSMPNIDCYLDGA